MYVYVYTRLLVRTSGMIFNSVLNVDFLLCGKETISLIIKTQNIADGCILVAERIYCQMKVIKLIGFHTYLIMIMPNKTLSKL